jgi:dienelactone hydrolase
MTHGPPLAGYSQYSFSAHGFVHPVYHTGAQHSPAVLVLQELPGFAPGLQQFGTRLADAGFHAHLPWLFGPFGARTPLRNFARLCISREFAGLRAGESAPVTDWLRALVGHISSLHDGAPVAAIGMCVTGGFVIPLLLDPHVRTAVAAQPSIPLSPRYLLSGSGDAVRRAALNVATTDIAGARERLDAGEARLLAVRCLADRLCPPEKLRRLEREFPVGLTVREYGEQDSRNAAGERPHATYTKEYRLGPAADATHYSRVAFAELVQYLRGDSAA